MLFRSDCGYSTTQIKALTGSGENASYYDPTWTILEKAVAWYKQNNTDIADYDNNKDGILDGVWLVYSAPYYSETNGLGDTFWAYTYWDYDALATNPTAANPVAGNYCWASYNFMLFIILAIIFVPLFCPYKYDQQLSLDNWDDSYNNLAPFAYSDSEKALLAAGKSVFPHIFGTDSLGRDYFIRVIIGTRVSLLVGFFAALIVLVIGSIYGAISGYKGGKVDMIMKRKQISFIILAAVPMILASCQQNATSTSTGTSYAPALNSSADHYNDTYAGYEVDLDGDGTIAATEKGLTWANSYDKIISTIKTTTDEAKRFKLMHAAETELMSTGAICPIYYYTDLFLKKETMTGYFGML